MNRFKRIIALSLSIVFLAGSTPVQAFSLKGLWSQYANKKAIAILVPATLIVGYLGYRLWRSYNDPKTGGSGKKKDTRETFQYSQNASQASGVSNKTTLHLSRKSEKKNYTVKQVPVLQQSEANGGAASCGYQAIKNYQLMVEGLTNDTDYKKAVKDPLYVHAYFEKNKSRGLGAWRRMIMAKRPKCKVMNYLSKQFGNVLKDVPNITNRDKIFESNAQQVNKIRELYRSAISKLTQNIRKYFLLGLTQKYDLSTDENIICDIQDLIKISPETVQAQPEGFAKYVQEKSTIEKYIDFKQLRQLFKCNHINTGITLDHLITSIEKDFTQSDRCGEWLDGDEIKLLIEQQVKQKHTDLTFNYTIVDNTDLIGLEGVCPLTPDITEKIKPNTQTDKQYIYGIIIGTMSQHSDTSGSMGHWFVVALHKLANGKREYIIVDSMNTDRLHDAKVKKVINCIEEELTK